MSLFPRSALPEWPELADAADSKSADESRVGSNPTSGTYLGGVAKWQTRLF